MLGKRLRKFISWTRSHTKRGLWCNSLESNSASMSMVQWFVYSRSEKNFHFRTPSSFFLVSNLRRHWAETEWSKVSFTLADDRDKTGQVSHQYTTIKKDDKTFTSHHWSLHARSPGRSSPLRFLLKTIWHGEVKYGCWGRERIMLLPIT